VLAAERRSKLPFPYFELPKEIRFMILELLLVRGNVAMSREWPAKYRFPSWNFERPQWALRAVNRLMRAEAAEVVFSSKNTFFVPLGGVQPGKRRLHMFASKMPWPPIKRLDCAFDMRDNVDDSYCNLWNFNSEKEFYDQDFGEGCFERLTREEKWDIIHEAKVDDLMEAWQSYVEAIEPMNLDLLRLDLTDCRCSAGCCRLGRQILETFDYNNSDCYPSRIEIVGAQEWEEASVIAAMENRNECLKGRIFLVDREPALVRGRRC